uniref:Protein FAR1-RELATED SEQUENCE n=1 Tax=Chenopodium quinoa TaxID=63459 RepID=A0A803LWI9_CHEQI
MLDVDLNEPLIEEENNDDEPFIGQTFESQEEAYVFYNKYAKQHGFVVRKDRSDTRHGRTIRRDFYCHCGGKKPLKVVDFSKPQRNKESSKCDCKAHMRITLKKCFDIFPEEWHVTKYSKQHNHVMLPPEAMRFLPSNRNISGEDEKKILLLKEAGLSARQIIRVLELEKNVGHGELPFIQKDVRNLFGRVKRLLGANDSKSLLEYMKSTNEENNKFQYAYTVDGERSCWFATLLRENYQKWCADFYNLYKMTITEEFERSWTLMIAKYNLQENKHVQGLYNVALAVQEICQGQSHSNMVATLRPISMKTKSPLEGQAFEVFTSFAFKKFQDELIKASQYSIIQIEGNIPSSYLPLRWHCDRLQPTVENQEIISEAMILEEESETVHNDIGVGGDDVLCPPKSKTKGRPPKKRERGGKESGKKKTKCCSICKQPGHTKPTCPNKENIFSLNDTNEGTSSATQKKTKEDGS